MHDRQGAECTAQRVEAAGRNAAVYQLDVRELKKVAQLVQDVKGKTGVPTILVNDAGIDSTGKPIKDMNPEALRDPKWNCTVPGGAFIFEGRY